MSRRGAEDRVRTKRPQGYAFLGIGVVFLMVGFLSPSVSPALVALGALFLTLGLVFTFSR